MITLNKVNGADIITAGYASRLLSEFDGELYGCIMGVAYGGDVETTAKIWKNRGKVWGFDVFEDLHPKHLAEDINGFDALCMDYWYQDDVHGTAKLALEYQEQQLKDQGLDNAILVKGEVHKDSCKDIPHLHYAFLDMDIPESMRQGYSAVKDKIVKHGYLLLHDTQNIPGLTEWRDNEVLGEDKNMWHKIGQHDRELIVVLKKVV